jgi:hypothetical protein
MNRILHTTRSPHADRGHDLYETSPVALTPFLDTVDLPDVLWEPACGRGAIVRALRARGHQVYATDLIDYDSRDQDVARWDFFKQKQLPIGVRAIITNPPYKTAARFVQHALDLCPLVFMLLKLSFLEAGNDKTVDGRARLLAIDGGKLARVYVFRNRLPMMHRDGWTGNKVPNPTAYAWFCWDHAHRGPATIHRLTWVPA